MCPSSGIAMVTRTALMAVTRRSAVSGHTLGWVGPQDVLLVEGVWLSGGTLERALRVGGTCKEGSLGLKLERRWVYREVELVWSW